jgi:hypothetical protein
LIVVAEEAMVLLRQAGRTVLALLPAIILAVASVPVFFDGLALEAAIPVPNYMILHRSMPKAAYEDVQTILLQADRRDGAAVITRAEAAMDAGNVPQSQIDALKDGLMYQPASARGWTLLAEAYTPIDKKRAARALAQSLLLSSRDYYLAAMRVHDAALLWSDLDAETKGKALEQARLLWEEPALQNQLRVVLASREGVDIVAKAFAGRSDEVREMNRWLSVQRSRTPAGL